MLVLSRKCDEKIIIGEGEDQITVTIVKVQGEKVSLGIEAKKDTPIVREELIRTNKTPAGAL